MSAQNAQGRLEPTPEALTAGVREMYSWDLREDDPQEIVKAVFLAVSGFGGRTEQASQCQQSGPP